MLPPLDVLQRHPSHDGTLSGLLSSRVTRNAQKGFVFCEGRERSYQGFAREVDACARLLVARGIGPGERVAAMAPNSLEYVRLLFAAARINAILVPVNPDFGVEEARYIFGHAGVSAIATAASTRTVAAEAARSLARPPWLFSLEDEISGTDAPAALPEPRPEATCLILYTSGTTGFPKGVMHSQKNFVMAGEGFVARLWLQPQDRLLCVLPMFHINALFYSLAGALAAGASLVIVPKFSASGFWRTAAETGATQVNIIAAIGNILARRPRSEFDPRHKLRVLYGAPISPDLERVLREEFRIPVVIEGYGMTEIPGAANNPFDGEKRPGSFGLPAKHPDPGVNFAELKIVDDELRVKTPILMQGYWRDPEQTAASIEDGWFKTGDLVRRDAGGYYYFVARKKDIIRRRGENISGAEIDRVVGDHPAVLLCAAIPVPSELGEDEILIAVVRKPGSDVTAKDLEAWCRERLAAIKVPRYVAFVDSLPLTPTQRVQKFQLRGDPTLLARAIDLQSC